MPVSTAQCCPFSQNLPAAECSYIANTLQGRIPGSRPPWLPLRSLFPSLPSRRFLWEPDVGWSAFRCTVTLSTALYTSTSVFAVCFGPLWVSWAEIAILFWGLCCRLIAFALFTFPAPRCWYHQIRGASSNTGPTNGLSGRPPAFQRPSVSQQSL